MPIMNVGPYQLDYVEAGVGPAVVLVHSSAAGNRQWRKFMEELAGRYRLIAVNLFGYGATSKWPADRPLMLADQAALIAAAAALDPGPVALIGHSLGGAVAMEAARRLGARVRVLAVFEPILFYLLKDHDEKKAFAEIDAIRTGFIEYGKRDDWEAVGRQFIDYWSGDGTWAATPDDRKAGIFAMLAPVMHEWEMIGTSGRPIEDWGAIAAPVHVLRAADSRLSTRTVAALLQRAHPTWHFHEVAAGGHMAPLTRPDLVNPLLMKILDAYR